MKKVLGIDPGIRNCGWAVLKFHGQKTTLLESGVIKTKGEAGPTLQTIYDGINQIIDEFNPKYAALETVFFNRNVNSAIRVGEARGVLTLALANKEVESAHYTPQRMKKLLTGSGKADKELIQTYVKILVGKEIKNEHQADAIAAAWCYAIENSWVKHIEL